MVGREYLTNEHLKKMFKDNFSLTNYSIKLSKHMIKSGKETTLDIVLKEVANTAEHRNDQ